jgi:histidinol-phosphatase
MELSAGTSVDLSSDLAFALELADRADEITLPLYEDRSFAVDRKPDRSEVTEADRAAEAMVRDMVTVRRPDHAFVGEETGAGGNAGSPWTWTIDPIDGTSNFVRGVPVWASLVALAHDRHGPVVGVVSAPALGRRWWAARGLGAFANGRQIGVSAVDDLAAAHVCVTFNDGWDALGLTPRLVELQRRAGRARGFGDFWQHMLVAEGAVDAAVDAIGVQPYDLAAPCAIVREAGGTFTDRRGDPVLDTASAVSSNGLLHRAVIDVLRGTSRP